MCAHLQPDQPVPRDGYIPVENAELYYREAGQGRPIVVLHGGPDFSHDYLLPDLDRLSDAFRLIYYDQRGRGRSARGVQPADVSLASDVADLDAVRAHFHLRSVALLGHSWGGLLAMEYALRHPRRISHLILLNTAFASHDDAMLYRQERRKSAAGDLDKMKELSATDGYQEGNPDTVADYYRIHFRTTLRRPRHLEQVIESLRLSFTNEGVLKARVIEDRLMNETWSSSEYNLLPELERLSIPTLVIHGEYDLVPVEAAAHIAAAIPGARFVLLKDCGQFTYLECPDEVRKAIVDFFEGA